MRQKAARAAVVCLGVLFSLWYVFQASDNVAYSDYIRLINSYLPDVDNLAKFFVPDILTRVSVTYLGRLINVKCFGYNTFFDLILGVLSLGAGAAALCAWRAKDWRPGFGWFILIQFVYFSLNKWEMILNGTGWVCILSVSGFLATYVTLDRAYQTGCQSRVQRGILLALPPALTLLVAGPYCGAYSAVMLAALAILLAAQRRDRLCVRAWAGCALAVGISLGLYLWSNSYAVYVHRGAVENGNLLAELFRDPAFFVRFLLKAFASAAVGLSQLQQLEQAAGPAGRAAVYLLGAAVIAMYLWALYLNVRCRLYQKSILPLLLIVNGGFNHLLILMSRWIFLSDEYGMSSRYEIQYQLGILGILMTFALIWAGKKENAQEKEARQPGACARWLALFCSLCILAGNLWTTGAEIQTAPFRKAYLAISRDLGLNYRTASDEDLELYLHSGADEIRSAMEILEENKLNIFREK